MEFDLTEQQQMIRKMVREFAQSEVRPIATEIDRNARFPVETVQKMAKLGLMGMFVPPEYGGAGVDKVSYVIAIEELARVCASTAVITSVNNSLSCVPLLRFGTEEQKQKYLKELASGRKLGAYCLTEPGSGSDAAALRSTLVRDGEGYRLNGEKIWVTNGIKADYFVVYCTSDRTRGNKGISAVIVERTWDGVGIGKEEEKLGVRASGTCGVTFNNVFVPEENRLANEGDGFKVAMATLDNGRLGIAAQAVGIAQGAIDESLDYAKVRSTFGKLIAEHQAIQFMFADMATEVDAARWLTYRAAWLEEQGQRITKEAAMAKLFASDVAVKTTRRAVQILGGMGYSGEYPLERMYRDAKITEIYEGTSEIQRIVIAANLGLR